MTAGGDSVLASRDRAGPRPPDRNAGMDDVVAPTRSDPVARAFSEVVGGPAGSHGLPHPWWTPVRVLLALTAVVMGLAIIGHQPCLKTYFGDDQARYAKMCYSDVPYLYTGRGLSEGQWPYGDDGGRYPAMEYPVGIVYAAWGVAQAVLLAPEGPPLAQRRATEPSAQWSLPGMPEETNTYFLATALLLTLAALATTWLLAGVDRRRPWDALPFVLSPALLMTSLVNWDLLAVVLVAGVLWAWARGRPLLTGVLIGLGTATKLYPLFLLGGVLVIAVRRRRWADLGLAVGGAVAAWLVANLPAMVTGREQWDVFWRYNTDRGADLGSWWLVLSHQGVQVSASAINAWSWGLFATLCLAIAVLGLRVRRTPRLAQLGFLVVVAFLLVNKVYSPQYVLWLLPLAVIARPRWRDLLIWQVGELLYVGAVWLYLGGWLEGAVGGRVPFYDLAIWVRIAAELYLVVMVVRAMVRAPAEEPGSADQDLVDVGGGEPDADVDLVPDARRG